MALINSFGSLKTALSRYMFHPRFVPDYDLAVANFEAAANRRLRVQPMEASIPLTTVNGEVALPADYLLWRTLLYTDTSPAEELEYVHPAYLGDVERDPPRTFTIEGSLLKARPIDDRADLFELHYYQRIPTILSSETASNWLITNHHDCYEFGTLTELFALGRNVEAAQLYKARRDEVLAEIIRVYSLTTAASSPSVRGQGAEFF